jgi:C4-dicarboxylate-specific signal transduction histidine kinase
MNLLSNALDATLQVPEGKVAVIIETAGPTVSIVIRDNGPGISDEVREKIFSPFFTTKPPGKGTGLGLSISAKIVSDHGGRLYLRESSKEGTEFVVELSSVYTDSV